jgi:uncharacterized protein (DUF488 family)
LVRLARRKDERLNGIARVLTIGHSRHPLERFIGLLESAGATAVADVRSAPVSRFSPQFNRAALAASLAERNIAYIFLGNELGGRPARPELYSEGVADYEKMAASNEFRGGIARLTEAAARHRVAVMCAEADPLDCHRCLLVARALAEDGFEIGHVLASGAVMPHREAEDRLLDLAGLAEASLLLSSRDARLAEAYRARAGKAAYAIPRKA